MSSLKQEIHQTRPFESKEAEAYLNLIRTNEVASRSVNDLFKQHGLTQVLYNVLRIVRGGGESGVTCTQIGERMVTRVPDVTRLVDRLVKMKLVTRVRNENDRRVVELFLTKKGAALLKKIDRPLKKLQENNFAHMTKSDLDTLIHLLTKARQGFA